MITTIIGIVVSGSGLSGVIEKGLVSGLPALSASVICLL